MIHTGIGWIWLVRVVINAESVAVVGLNLGDYIVPARNIDPSVSQAKPTSGIRVVHSHVNAQGAVPG